MYRENMEVFVKPWTAIVTKDKTPHTILFIRVSEVVKRRKCDQSRFS